MRKEIYRILAAMAVVFLVVSALYADGKNTRFRVISTIPRNGARGVPTDQTLTVTFNQKLDCSTVNTLTFTLKSDKGHHGAVAGVVDCLGTQATFTLLSDLAPNTTYTATIKERVKDAQGKRLECDFCWCFKTGSGPTPPTVTAVTPLNGATGVALNLKIITATFDQEMLSATINGSNFTVNGGVTGTVSLDATGTIATFTITSGNLTASTTYTATISTGVENLAGNAMASPFVWTFKTGATPDITPPTVILTNPVNGATGVPLNKIITATFSEAMAPATIQSPLTTFTLKQTTGSIPVLGTVTYAVIGNMATFTPQVNLLPNTQYTATVTTAATDLAGNPLGPGIVPNPWTFRTGTAADTTPPTVKTTNPLNAQLVCINGAINATFSEPVDPATIDTASFYVTGPASVPVIGTVSLDVTGTIATFTPTSNLTSGTSYTATITTAVTDLAGNPLASNHVWYFTASGTSCTAAVPLDSAATFGGFGGGAGMTNQGSYTVINGDIGTTAASSTMTGFHDTTEPYIPYSVGCIYSESGYTGTVKGEIFTDGPTLPTVATCPNEGTAATMAVATQAAFDALQAYNALAAMPSNFGCPGAGNGAGLTLPPGVYTCASSFGISLGDLTLDAAGNANAVWVFQIGSALTVGTASVASSVKLIHGAQAKNVFWQVVSHATINYGGGGTMVGTIIANTGGISISSPGVAVITTLDGRALSLVASVTMVNTVINVPAP